jgi:hypothetical protein
MGTRRCPHCSFEQAEGLPECGRCGVFFDKWREREAKHPQPAPGEAPVRAARDSMIVGKLKGLAIKLACVTAGVLVIWLVLCPSGLPVLPGSRVDEDRGFAVKVPEGWTLLSSEERFHGDFATVLTFERPGINPAVPMRAGVAVTQRDLPCLKLGVKLDWSPFVTAALPGAMESFQIDTVQPDTMDRLRAIRIEGSGERPYQTTETVEVQQAPRSPYEKPGESPPAVVSETRAVTRSSQCRFRVQASRGAEQTYIVAVSGRGEDFDAHSAEVRAIPASLRVLYRRYSVRHLFSVLGGQMREEVIVFILVSVWAFYRWMLHGALDE